MGSISEIADDTAKKAKATDNFLEKVQYLGSLDMLRAIADAVAESGVKAEMLYTYNVFRFATKLANPEIAEDEISETFEKYYQDIIVTKF